MRPVGTIRILLITAFSLLFIMITSCKKEVRTFDVGGKVYDPQLGKDVSGVKVVLRGAKVQYGIYNTTYVDLQNTTTSSDGSFQFEVPEETVSGYRFYFSKEGYFDYLLDVPTEDIQDDDGYQSDIYLIPIAYVELSVKNTMPVGSDDKISFRFTNVDVQCKDCWTKETIVGIGPTYSFKRTAKVSGEKELILNWVVKKNGQQHVYSDTIYAKAFQTVSYNINY